jgi:putative addiction module killer protein
MAVRPKEVQLYVTEDGHVPFEAWLNGLRDLKTKATVDARIARLRLGLLGNAREVGEGVHELKIDFGPGYRVYFANIGRTIIILLSGGDKSTQKRDIKKAKTYWADFQRRHR